MTSSTSVRWAELRPDDFRARRDACPIVYLPIGLCEPHGHIAALGLDLIKAEYFCEQAAQRFGGIVAPAQGYHIHECGFHAPWLAEVVGEENPFLGAIPPHVMLHLFLYQLRSFALAGFQGVIAVSGMPVAVRMTCVWLLMPSPKKRDSQ
jgi:creatinine amidohydrolase